MLDTKKYFMHNLLVLIEVLFLYNNMKILGLLIVPGAILCLICFVTEFVLQTLCLALAL